MFGSVVCLLFAYFAGFALSSHDQTVVEYPNALSNPPRIPHNEGSRNLDQFFERVEENETCPSHIPHRQLSRDNSTSTNEQRCEGDALSDAYFCVYTDPEFFHGRGITLITTSSIMESVNIPEMEDVPQGCGNVAVDEPYVEQYIPGKGIGLVANRLIKRGEVIIFEPPSIIVNLDMGGLVKEETRLEMQWEGIYNLPRETKSKSLGLMGHFGGDHLDDVLNTNAFGVDFGGSVDHRALFPQVSVSGENLQRF